MKAAFLISNKKYSRRITFHAKKISDYSRKFFPSCVAGKGYGSELPTIRLFAALLVVTAFVETAG